MNLNESPAWKALERHCDEQDKHSLSDCFRQDPQRGTRLSLAGKRLYLDYSKNRIDDKTLSLLFALARERRLNQAIDAMFAGEHLNNTEDRAVLHTLLRVPESRAASRPGLETELAAVYRVLQQMTAFCRGVHSGHICAYHGDRFTDVVSIGIGGSFLGPKLVCKALQAQADNPLRVHFVANVDGYELEQTLKDLAPEKTLFIIQSKTFTTLETLLNARAARQWLTDALSEAAIARQMVAVSSNREATAEFGITPEHVFEFWNWVGGRYSLWSAIGLPIMLGIGIEAFQQLLNGAFEMDEHFRTAPLEENMPVILALMSIWYNNFHGYADHAVIPYDQRLAHLPDFLQQLEMESNGKSVDRDNQLLDHHSGPTLWGDVGTNAQHAFFQHFHQGTRITPVDFLLGIEAEHGSEEQHQHLIANCLAQAEALLNGRSSEQLRREMQAEGHSPERIEQLVQQRSFSGNRPSNTLLYLHLDAATLGNLIALYEHRVFVQAWIWNINAFDQWGVELGKQLASTLYRELMQSDEPEVKHDSSTTQLLKICQHKNW